MIRDGLLRVDCIPETFGDKNDASRIYKRLELDYTCNGKSGVALAVYGDILTIDPSGNYRTDRVNRPK